MLTRKIAAIVVVAAGVAGFAACGNSAKAPADGGTTPNTTAPAPAPTAQGGNGY